MPKYKCVLLSSPYLGNREGVLGIEHYQKNS